MNTPPDVQLQIRTRPMVADDLRTVFELTMRTRINTYRDIIPSNRLEEFLAVTTVSESNYRKWVLRVEPQLYDEGYYHACAEYRSAVVGYIALRIHEPDIFIRNMYVDSLCQGLGIGTKLLATAEQELQPAEVRLEVLKGNTGAIAMYERWGFMITGDSRSNYFGAPKLCMAKSIIQNH